MNYMSMIRRVVVIFYLTLIVMCSTSNSLFAYNDDITHPDITERAMLNSQIEKYLFKNLGFTGGLKTKFKHNSDNENVIKWLRIGSIDEDDPMCRAVNHFHNPLKTWDQSHMSDDEISFPKAWTVARAYCELRGWTYNGRKSNVTWATGFKSPAPDGQKDDTFSTEPNFSPVNWDVAREYYYNALTSVIEEDRESNFALTFVSVGHVVHLMEDMAVPAHTRNDFVSHVVFNEIDSPNATKWFGNLYEYYVKKRPALVDMTPIYPSFTNPVLTDFWDTDQYISGGDPISGNAIGLAEYTNANFLSLETIFEGSDPLHGFQHPGWISVVEYEEDVGGKIRTYLRKLGSGETADLKIGFGDHVEHIARGKWFYKYLPSFLKNKGLTLDDAVYQDYAEKLLPRAVGYSSSLIDYFFRGKLKPVNLEGVQNGSNETTQVKMKIKNNTPDESMLPVESTFIVSYRYNLSGGDFIYGTSNEVVMNEEIPSGAVSTNYYTFNFSPVIPNNAENAEFWFVYKGKLGNEEGAVMAKYIEPVTMLIIPGDHATRELLPKQYHNFSVITKTFTPTTKNDLLFNILDDSAGWDDNLSSWTALADPDGLGVPLSVGGPQNMTKYWDETNNTVRIVTNLSYEKETYL